MNSTTDSNPAQFLRFIGLSKGVTSTNMVIFYWGCLSGIMLAAFTPQLLPYLMTELLQAPKEQQGVMMGKLTFYGELAIIATTGLWGPMSDKFGRRPLMAGSYVIVGVSMFIFPQVSDFNGLIAARILFSIGIGCFSCLIITLLADYVRDSSRGKAAGLLGVSNGLGALFSVIVLVQLPAIFQAQGMSPIDAGIATYNLAGVIALASAVAMWFGLKKIEIIHTHKGQQPSLLQLARKGLAATKDPGIGLAYASAFIARANVALVGAFFILWLQQYGTIELGIDTAKAAAKAGIMLGIAQSVALLSAPIFGMLTDRINRVDALIITLAIGTAGYGGTYFVTDPFSYQMIICGALIGMAEVGCIITSSVLISQQAPVSIRGSVMGFYNLSGGVGILICGLVGGYLFDHWLKQGPFLLIGAFSFLVMIWAIIVRNKVVPLNESADAMPAH